MPLPRPTIESCVDDPAFKFALRLRSRSDRDESGLFFAEGVRFVARAIRHRTRVETLITSPDILTSPAGRRLAANLRQDGVHCVEVLPDAFRRLSLLTEPQGIGAVLRQTWTPLREVRPSDGLCWVAAKRVRAPGNLGTIIRTCDAVGAAGLIALGDDLDPFHPAAVRATMGSLFNQRIVRTSYSKFMKWAKRHRCQIVGTSPAARTDFGKLRYRRPTILFMGDERKGMSEFQQSLCDVMVRIPMVGEADSLNLAVATSLMLYEVFRVGR